MTFKSSWNRPTNDDVQIDVRVRNTGVLQTFLVRYSLNSDLSNSVDTTPVLVNPAANDGFATLNVTGLDANTIYYYDIIRSTDGALYGGSYPRFRTRPAVSYLDVLYGASCFNHSIATGSPIGNILQLPNNDVNCWHFAMLGDWGYMEDIVTGSTWNPNVDTTPPPESHYVAHFDQIYANTYVETLVANKELRTEESDHDRLSGSPDVTTAQGTAYTHNGEDVATDIACFPGSEAARNNWIYPAHLAPNADAASGKYYGSQYRASDQLVKDIYLDSRMTRRRQLGRWMDTDQLTFLHTELKSLVRGQVAIIHVGDRYYGFDGENGDGIVTDTRIASALPVGYKWQTGAMDALIADAIARGVLVIVISGDQHTGGIVKCKSGAISVTASPVDDHLQRVPGAATAWLIKEEIWSSKDSVQPADNRLLSIQVHQDASATAIIYRGNSGGTNVPEVDFTYPIAKVA